MLKALMKKINSQRGMTMAEMLTVVAIVIILASVAFIAVMSHQRSLAQLERDAIAQEMFVAAQNHLTAAKGANYSLGSEFDVLSSNETQMITRAEKIAGTREKTSNDDEGVPSATGSFKGVYYIVVNKGDVLNNPEMSGNYMLNQMLPFGSIDENVRGGGKYIIRYQPNIGKVLDVFYWSDNPARYDYSFAAADYYTTLAPSAGVNNKDKRRKFPDGTGPAVIGWCGGETVETLQGGVQKPEITIVNSNRLLVKSRDKNSRLAADGITLRLIIEGKQSGAKQLIEIQKGTGFPDSNGWIENTDVVLDDITRSGLTDSTHKRFSELFQQTQETGKDMFFIPGEDLQIQLIAYSSTKIANIAQTDPQVVNSLFESILSEKRTADTPSEKKTYSLPEGGTIEISDAEINTEDDTAPNTAYIGCIRHLENLDKAISNVDGHDGTNANDKLKIDKAIQVKNINWKDFTDDEGITPRTICYGGNTPTLIDSDAKNFKPVSLDGLTYDGKNHSIRNIVVDKSGTNKAGGVSPGFDNAGLFNSSDALSGGEKISNLKLIDFNIQGTKYAGALAGSLKNTEVTNVIAFNSNNAKTRINMINSGVSAGGLIGKMSGGNASYSAAAMVVDAPTAGGLIGTIDTSSQTSITGCYSAGHTKEGSYKDWTEGKNSEGQTNGYDITGSICGGLIGNAGNAEISNCYSTCSVSGSETAGGFVGEASGSISDSYSAGLVNTEVNSLNTVGAFAGSLSLSGEPSECYYYEVVSEKTKEEEEEGKTKIVFNGYLGPVGDKDADGIDAFDKDTASMKRFLTAGIDAKPYDLPYLLSHYNDNSEKAAYIFKSVTKPEGVSTDKFKKEYFVSTHYGDWPAPEVFIINN